MASFALFAPVVLPLAAAALVAIFGRGNRFGRVTLAVAMWGSIVALIALWVPLRSSQEVNLGHLGFGADLDLRIDAVSLAFGLMILFPAAVLLTLQPRTWQEGTVAALGVASALLAVEAGGILLTALAGGTAATLTVMQLDLEDARAPRPPWGIVLAGWLALAWAGVTLEVSSGTAAFLAVPVSALTVPVFSLLAAAAIIASGLFFWRGWAGQLWSRPSLRASGMAVATLYPLGFYLLVRAYEMGDGRYPQPALNAALAVLGVLVAFGAAARAQAASTRREYLGEVIPGLGGFALMGISLGTPLGLDAGIATLATAAVLAASLPLLPDRAGPAALVTIAAAAGLPPGLAFGARVVGLEAAFEAGGLIGLLGIAGVVTWVISLIAAARAIGLPAGRGHAASETSPRGAMVLAAATVVAGPALALLLSAVAIPAQSDVMASPPGVLGGGATAVVSVTTVLPTLALFVPALVFVVLAYLASGPITTRAQPRPSLFALPARTLAVKLREQLNAAAVPEEYRSLIDLRALEAAAVSGRPLLWLGALVAIAFAVTR